MKRIVSVSIGSSKRDSKAVVRVLGEEFSLERMGTDGDIQKAIATIKELDGKVAAFGMGGIDLYPVSYTHLDVYKRQGQLSCGLKMS